MTLGRSSHSTPLEAEPVDVLNGADQIYEDEGVERTDVTVTWQKLCKSDSGILGSPSEIHVERKFTGTNGSKVKRQRMTGIVVGFVS